MVRFVSCLLLATSMSTPARAVTISGELLLRAGVPFTGTAEITVQGKSVDGERVVRATQADAQGHYRVELPAGKYEIVGWAEAEGYSVPLTPSDFKRGELDVAADLVKNFQLRIDGPHVFSGRDGADPGNYLGGWIETELAGPIVPGAMLTMVLTPAGPMADGSETENMAHSQMLHEGDSGQNRIIDVPLGRWIVEARYGLPGKPSKPVQLALGDGEAKTQVEVTFPAAPAKTRGAPVAGPVRLKIYP